MNKLDYQKIKIEFLKKQKELDRQKVIGNVKKAVKKQAYNKRSKYFSIDLLKLSTACFLVLTFICSL